MEVKAVRGMHDLWGDELARWSFVESHIRAVFSAFGYTEIRTPVLEKIEVFSQAVGEETDIVEKQMYTVMEGSEKLVLRPEGTASFIRAIIEHQLHRTEQAQRYFYYMPMFRHERPQKGRLRQFFQFGAELILDPSPEADAELILLLHRVYQSFGIEEYEVRINSVGDENCRPVYKEALKDFFRPQLPSLCELCQKRFERSPLRILDCQRDSCKEIAKSAPLILDYLCEGCRTHHTALKKCLEMTGVPYVEDATIVRGLDYYSRTAFEFTSNLLGAQSALGGGGRYDGLSARFGEAEFPAVGFALGMERLMMVLEEKQRLPDVKRAPLFFFAALGAPAFERLYPLGFALKREGVAVEMSYDRSKSLKSQLKQANRSGAPYALILGDTEIAENKALLKDMKSSTQEFIPLNTLEAELIRRSKLAV